MPLLLGQAMPAASVAKPILPWQPLRVRAQATPVVYDFEALTAATTPVASSDLYTPWAAEYVGGWWALKGNGAMQAGSQQTLSAVSSPTSQTLAAIGADSGLAAQYLISGARFHTGAIAGPAGSFSVVAAFALTSTAPTSQVVVAQDDISTNKAFDVFVNASGTVSFRVGKQGGTTTMVTSAAVITARSLHFIALTYQYATDGTSVLTGYVDGVQVAQSTTAVGPADSDAVPVVVGQDSRETGSNVLEGNVLFVGFTEKVLALATVQAMASKVVPQTLYDARGRALTFARTSAASFVDASGRMGWVKAARPRIVSGAYLQEAQGTNILTRSEDLASGWTNEGLTSVTNAYAFNVDSTKTAARLVSGAVGAGQTKRLYAGPLAFGTGQYTLSFYAAGTSTAQTLPFWVYNGAAHQPLQSASLTTTLTRYVYTFTGGGAGGYVEFGNSQSSTTQTTGAFDVLLADIQLETGTQASSYVLTTSTSATRTADDLRWSWAGLLDRAAFATRGEASAEVFATAASGGERILGWDSSGVHESALYVVSGTQLGSTNAAGAAATSASATSIVGRWAAGKAVWGQSLAVSLDGAQGAADGTYASKAFTSNGAALRIGANAAGTFSGYVRNVRLRVLP